MKPYAADRVLLETFVGRKPVLEEIATYALTGRSVSISAGRRTGKTMLMRTVAAHLASKGASSIYVDCQSLVGPDTAAQFVRLVVEKSVGVGANSVSMPADILGAAGQVVSSGRRFCLIIDEIEGLAQAPSGSIVLDNLRHLVSNSSVAGDATVIISGGLDLTVRLRSAGSSLANVCRPLRLQPLTRDELADLVDIGVPALARDYVLEHLWIVAGGHPYVAQYLLESMSIPVPEALDLDMGNASRDCVERIRSHVRSLDPLVRNGARQLVRLETVAGYLGEVLVDAGLARQAGGRLIPNGDLIARAIQSDEESDRESAHASVDPNWVTGLLAGGETEMVEFKESVKWDVRRQVETDSLKYEVPQAVAAFMNSNGGTLILGVTDDGVIAGLEPDMGLIRRNPTLDGVTVLVSNLLRDALGGAAARDVRFASTTVNARVVLALTVESADAPVFMKLNGKPHFMARIGPSTVELDVQESVEYIDRRWPRR